MPAPDYDKRFRRYMQQHADVHAALSEHERVVLRRNMESRAEDWQPVALTRLGVQGIVQKVKGLSTEAMFSGKGGIKLSEPDENGVQQMEMSVTGPLFQFAIPGQKVEAHNEIMDECEQARQDWLGSIQLGWEEEDRLGDATSDVEEAINYNVEPCPSFQVLSDMEEQVVNESFYIEKFLDPDAFVPLFQMLPYHVYNWGEFRV